MPKRTSVISSSITSPTDAASFSPSSKGRKAANNRDAEASIVTSPSVAEQPHSPGFTSLPPFPSSPKDTTKHSREPSKGFFSNLRASKSSNKVHQVEPTIRQVSEDITRSDTPLNETSIYSLRKSPGSTSDLSLSTFDSEITEAGEELQGKHPKYPRRPVGTSVQSDSLVLTSPPERLHGRKSNPRFGALLTRTRSTRMDGGERESKPTTPIHTTGPATRMQYDGPTEDESHQLPPMTAPLQQDRSLRDMMNSGNRNRSADRQTASSSRENMTIRRGDQASIGGLSASSSGNFRENNGSHLLTNLKNMSSKAADGLGKAGKGAMEKFGRSGSTTTKEEEPYVIHVINLPLVEQTRRTRIAQRLADSRDKTEFWMPALPWRCIDYLNFRGCEEEGLYRVPGSDIQIRRWRERFDQEGDINLFDEEDLYDINIIGSMFKSWLRELPTEIFPKAIQAKIADECAGAQAVPQLLKDELSKLPPWNYYLLFAITCHLSLLTAYAEKNKMTYGNLCICFQPALRVDAFCFQFLVQDWRNCWQGCWTEKEYLEEEYQILDALQPGAPSSDNGVNWDGGSSTESTAVADERSLASSDSHKPSIGGRTNRGPPPPLMLTKASEERLSTPTEENGYTKSATQLPELAPMMPLSPIRHLT